jgi:serine/threonine protein kinase
MSRAPRHELRPGTVVDGRYVVDGLLGTGGMASVYRAHHRELGTDHALKVLTVSMPSLLHRLRLEGRVQASLRHPNVVAVTDLVALDGTVGLVMEFVRGPTLDALLQARQLELAEVDTLAAGLFDAVEAAHTAGIVHRDLKPANVLLAVGPSALVPKVADFGLVKVLEGDDGATRSGMSMGTPSYMAPEQIEDAKRVDTRADVWSLGAVLFELASGQRAFEGAGSVSSMWKVARGDRAALQDIRPDLPLRIFTAVDAALVTDREGRPATIGALRQLWFPDGPPPEARWSVETLATAERLAPPVEVDPVSAGATPDVSRWVEDRTTVDEFARGGATAVPLSGPSPITTAGAPPPTVAAAPSPPSRSPVPAAVAALALAFAFTLLATSPWWWPSAPPADPPPGRAGGGEGVAVRPAPPPPPAPAPAPRPAPPSPVAPVRPQEPRPEPRPPSPEPPPPPAEPPPRPLDPPPRTTGTLRVTGNGVAVTLQDEAGHRVYPGELPPGKYKVLAYFSDTDPVAADFGPFILGAGDDLQVTCLPGRGLCRVE